MSEPDPAVVEANLRAMNWKARIKALMGAVREHHRPLEVPVMIRRWLEVNRSEPKNQQEAEHVQSEVRAIQWWIDAQGDAGRWFEDKTEKCPIFGWIVSAMHMLIDGQRWWLFAVIRHDDNAPLVGDTVPAPADNKDLRKLAKIISYAGGNPKRELLRTGAITKEEHDQFLAAGKPDIAEYGQILYWWKA